MKKIIIANWKMNLNIAQSKNLLTEFADQINSNNKEVVVCPAAEVLILASDIFKSSKINFGSQNIFWEDTGAYTGELSPAVLLELGAKYAIIGHSERRQYFQETDVMINRKAITCITHKIIPIICIGETLEQKQAGEREEVLATQLNNALENINLETGNEIIIAYEPVWAIGTGLVSTSEEADQVHMFIKVLLRKIFGETITENIKVIYGGSVNEENVADLATAKSMDGLLVGGASLKTSKFLNIIQNF